MTQDGKSYDITAYLLFPTVEEYEHVDFPAVQLAGWHFGPYSYRDAETFIDVE